MGPMMQPVRESFRFSNFIMNLVTSDLKNEDAVRRVRDGKGASISWIVGHLCHHRYEVMNLLGAGKDNTFEETFAAGASDGSNYPDIATLCTQWNAVSNELEEVCAGVTDDQLMNPPGGAPHGEKRVLDTLVFHMWHESYHIGQLGTIRTELGYRPTSELAVEAAQAGS